MANITVNVLRLKLEQRAQKQSMLVKRSSWPFLYYVLHLAALTYLIHPTNTYLKYHILSGINVSHTRHNWLRVTDIPSIRIENSNIQRDRHISAQKMWRNLQKQSITWQKCIIQPRKITSSLELKDSFMILDHCVTLAGSEFPYLPT